jgi:hypothetical protein
MYCPNRTVENFALMIRTSVLTSFCHIYTIRKILIRGYVNLIEPRNYKTDRALPGTTGSLSRIEDVSFGRKPSSTLDAALLHSYRYSGCCPNCYPTQNKLQRED